MKPMKRRTFLGGVAAGLAATQLRAEALGPVLRNRAQVPAAPFTLGVASGDPLPDSVVLWTRLAPDPLNGGGMPPGDVAIDWEVAADAGFGTIVAQGTTTAVAALAHSVHVEVSGLQPDSRYFYRFSADGFDSPVGQARTTPPAGSFSPLRFGFASCQNYIDGFYNAHAGLAQDDCDLVFFLGDYIYEGGMRGGARQHNSGEVITLADYRNRYGLYKSDPDLQAAHQSCSWGVVWDDHEVDNNYADDVPDDGAPAGVDLLVRRAAAYQAWWEHQPVRLSPPSGPDLTIYRQLPWGALSTFHLIDTRQYRSDQACGDGLKNPCPGWDDPSRTLLGTDQETWLYDRLAASTSVWNVMVNQVVFAPLLIAELRNMDAWDGYPAQQQRAWDQLQQASNPVVITGDIHAAGAARLHQDLTDASTPRLGYELVCTGISSIFDPNLADVAEDLYGQLDWIDYINAHNRGYTVVDLSAEQLTARFRVVSTTDTRGGTVRTDHTVELAARIEEPPPGTDPPPSTDPPPGTDPGQPLPGQPASPTAPPARPVTAQPSFTG